MVNVLTIALTNLGHQFSSTGSNRSVIGGAFRRRRPQQGPAVPGTQKIARKSRYRGRHTGFLRYNCGRLGGISAPVGRMVI